MTCHLKLIVITVATHSGDEDVPLHKTSLFVDEIISSDISEQVSSITAAPLSQGQFP